MVRLMERAFPLSVDDIHLIRRMSSYLRPYTRRYLLLLGATVSSLSVGLLQPLVFGHLIDALASNRRDLLQLHLAILLTVHLLSSLFSLGQTLMSVKVGADVYRNIKNDLFGKLINLPVRVYDQTQAGELVSRIEGDSGTLSGLLVGRSISILIDVGRLIGIGIIVFSICWELALLLLALFPLSTYVFGAFGRILKERTSILRQVTDQYQGTLVEIILGTREIRALGIHKHMHNKLIGKHNRVIAENTGIQNLGGVSVFVNTLLGGFGIVLMMFMGSRMILGNRLSIGDLVAFYSYSAQFYGAMRNMTQLNSAIQTSVVSMRRIADFMSHLHVSCVRHGTMEVTRPDGEIELSHVSFSYSNDRKTLEDLSLRISPRQITALVGNNGAGKSTILYLLLRFYEPDAGHIRYDGIDIGEIDMESWMGLVSAVLQEPFVFGGSIKENLQAVDQSLSIEEISAACKVLGLHQFISNLPQKYDTILGEELNLSAGQKQRLSIARCFLKKTPIILLDEPTSSLDQDAEKSLLDLIRQLGKTHTVVMVTHHPSAIEIADKVILVEDGRVVGENRACGTLQAASGNAV
jgi:ABC-type bacteriocin/lantibiotic exporter with double-glycine peptidase domain